MIIVYTDMEQRSQAWYEARRGVPTASEFSSILAKGQGKMRKAYMMRLAAERITGEVQETYTSHHMQRGREQEAEALDYYAWLTETELERVGFVFDPLSRCGCSPDALIGKDGMVEVKTRVAALQVELLALGGIPSEHRAQIQGSMWVANRQWCDFVAYSPGLPLHIVREPRDDDYIAALAEEIARFQSELDDVVRLVTSGHPSAFLRDRFAASAAL